MKSKERPRKLKLSTNECKKNYILYHNIIYK